MTKLALFDVDGTLLESNEFDISYYLRSVKTVLNLKHIKMNWSNYNNITDVGMLTEIYESGLGKKINDEIIGKVKEHFVEAIRYAFQSGAVKLKPIRGVQAVLEALRSNGDWAVALATGGWKESAELKLQCSGVELSRVPIFSANNAATRTGIIQKAIDGMLSKEGVGQFDKIVYLGDAIWDLRASYEVGVSFLGVGEAAQNLLSKGASHAIDDYSDLKGFMDKLDSCKAPTMLNGEHGK